MEEINYLEILMKLVKSSIIVECDECILLPDCYRTKLALCTVAVDWAKAKLEESSCKLP